jgi:hypothetical protein
MVLRLLLPFLCAFSINAFAVQPPPSNPLGSEENQYVTLWNNRAEIFGLCLKPEALCQLAPVEAAALQRMIAAANAWKPLRFYLPDEFALQSKNLLRSVKVPFIAFTPTPDTLMFDQAQMYEEANRFGYDKKLFLLAAVAAQQGGLTSVEADSMIRKLVAVWMPRWAKYDLDSVGEKALHVWVQYDPRPFMILFDNQNTFDLLAILTPNLRCSSRGVRNVQIGPANWSNHTKNGNSLFATLAGKLKVQCESGETYPISYEMDLPFQLSQFGWVFFPNQVKVHILGTN